MFLKYINILHCKSGGKVHNKHSRIKTIKVYGFIKAENKVHLYNFHYFSDMFLPTSLLVYKLDDVFMTVIRSLKIFWNDLTDILNKTGSSYTRSNPAVTICKLVLNDGKFLTMNNK